jgi:hypothetical protein
LEREWEVRLGEWDVGAVLNDGFEERVERLEPGRGEGSRGERVGGVAYWEAVWERREDGW